MKYLLVVLYDSDIVYGRNSDIDITRPPTILTDYKIPDDFSPNRLYTVQRLFFHVLHFKWLCIGRDVCCPYDLKLALRSCPAYAGNSLLKNIITVQLQKSST